TFKVGAVLYSDRTYTIKECPEQLNGKLFLRSSIKEQNFRCTAEGVLTLLTPSPENPRANSLALQLEQRGFAQVNQPDLFQLFGTQTFDRVCTYQKIVKRGERFHLTKWSIPVGFTKATVADLKPIPWNENKGEVLYNGIRLPEEWPPRNIDPHSTEPMPVPYLASPPSVIPIDVGRQLFVDDFLIQQTSLKRTLHKPVKYAGNPILKPETKLELNAGGDAIACPKSGGLWWDPTAQIFKLWYEAGWLNTICYATSRDGLHWDRPKLDVEPDTNRVLPTDMHCDSWTVVLDYWTQDPQQKYKMFVRSPGRDSSGTSMVSSDGIHWTNRTTSGSTGDRSTMFYNPFRKKWVYSLRSSFRGRSRHYWEADDFLAGAKWKPGEPAIWAAADKLDPPDPVIGDTAQLYNLDAVAYESLMLGFFEIHLGPANTECKKTGIPKITELQFAYSRDGFHWQRPDRNLCCVRGDKIWFYYIGFQGNTEKPKIKGHTNGYYDRGATGVAFLRRDGFASMDAGETEGALTTRPVRFTGSHLFVNAAAKEGKLRAEILDEAGQPIEPFTLQHCRAMHTDNTLEEITWNGEVDLAALRDRPVRLRFTLRNGSLYSFWVSRDASGRSDGYVAGGGPGFTGPTDTVGRAELDAEKGTLP
ncbi:MAG: hypothetical protein NTY53_12945, partial [Kiritimatiellaeota bacterium]|nr:hypothetical protein [Kiritimatiellota bacterium]